jgi:hypothetical protein
MKIGGMAVVAAGDDIPEGPLPHFELTRELFEALEYPEVMATLEALDQCGELKLPYEFQTIRFNVEDYACAPGWGGAKDRLQDCFVTCQVGQTVIYTKETTVVHICPVLTVEDQRAPGGVFTVDTDKNSVWFGGQEYEIEEANRETAGNYLKWSTLVTRLLLAALATKNVVKHTALNKRASRGVGSGKLRAADGKIRLSFTRLDVPVEFEAGTGRRTKFHLRRGHYHTYHIGPGRSEAVKKFVQAVLVNRDLQTCDAKVPIYEVTA